MKSGDIAFLLDLKKPSCGTKKITINQYVTEDFKAHIQGLDDIPRRTQPASAVSSARPHRYCFWSAFIHLCWIWGVRAPEPNTILPALILNLLLNFFIRENTSPLKVHICTTISTRTNPFSQKAWKEENRDALLYSLGWPRKPTGPVFLLISKIGKWTL